MRKVTTWMGAALILVLAGQARAAPPSPASCPRLPAQEEDTSGRKGAFALPGQFAAIARSNHDNLAVSTLDRTLHCIDVRSMYRGDDFGLSSDGRFFSFRWDADEAGGFILVDRTGHGQHVDTGARPQFSPTHQRFAAIEMSESGFGSLNGFAVWQVDPVGVRRLYFTDKLPHLQDWRMDGWSGETCVNLSAIAFGAYPENAADLPKVPRLRHVARPGAKGWTIARGTCPRS